jgi:hypothetical protein
VHSFTAVRSTSLLRHLEAEALAPLNLPRESRDGETFERYSTRLSLVNIHVVSSESRAPGALRPSIQPSRVSFLALRVERPIRSDRIQPPCPPLVRARLTATPSADAPHLCFTHTPQQTRPPRHSAAHAHDERNAHCAEARATPESHSAPPPLLDPPRPYAALQLCSLRPGLGISSLNSIISRSQSPYGSTPRHLIRGTLH